jgi:hypothetical protein
VRWRATTKRLEGRTGRPRREIASRPEKCPRGHDGTITLWGRREWTTAPFRRQRFRCVPADGSDPHTFSVARRPASDAHEAGLECLTCDIKPGLAEGPLSPPDYFHTGVEIAHLLQLVSQGMSLRKASTTVRLEAHRYVEDTSGARFASEEFALAARYLDVFGPLIDEQLAPKAWPKILILDSKPLNLRAVGYEEFDKTWNPQERGAAIFVAMGSDRPGGKFVPWRIGLAPDETAHSWREFLKQLPDMGDGPEWIVADGAKAIAAAVVSHWPNATFYSCEFHLRKAMCDAAKSDAIWTEDPKHKEVFEQALWDLPRWAAIRRLATAKNAANLMNWIQDNDAHVRQQIALHRDNREHPRSNATAERVLDWIDTKFEYRRRRGLRNAKRLQLVLDLIRTYHAGQADLATLAAIVKPKLRVLGPDDRLPWKHLHDPKSDPSSIAELIAEAHYRSIGANTAYMGAAKIRSILANIAAQTAELVALGRPPIVATITPGKKIPSVKVKGLMLERDFPLIARDWDTAANDRPLATIEAGSGYEAHWKCHKCGHTWEVEVSQRTMRQTRCRRCYTERADGRNSLAAVHPDLIPEWDDEANKPLRPTRIKATYDKAVFWKCRDDPTHPSYKMSVATRRKKPVGCPICRQRKPARTQVTGSDTEAA